jgi:predicted GNAT superfamily acetyltransferase
VLRRGRGEQPLSGDPPSPAGALVEVPPDASELKASVPQSAAVWRDAVADALEACFGSGLVATGFDRERSSYVFEPGTSRS